MSRVERRYSHESGAEWRRWHRPHSPFRPPIVVDISAMAPADSGAWEHFFAALNTGESITLTGYYDG